MKIYWSGSSSVHDWLRKPRTDVHRMCALAREAGVFGVTEWTSVGSDGERKPEADPVHALDKLIDRRHWSSGTFIVAAGGDSPLPWDMNLVLSHHPRSPKIPKSINFFQAWFDDGAFPLPEDSDRLFQAFQAIHTPANTEFALIHPNDQYAILRSIDGQFEDPVTIDPMFSGVYWAVFLGQEHLSLFDRSQLQDIETFQVEWAGEDGLYLRVTRDLRDATREETEKEMLRLTEIFKKAQIRQV